jgi:hypothetical protein
MSLLAPIITAHAPALVAAAGARASYRFLDFFTAQNQEPAYTPSLDWLKAKGVTQLAAIESVHVAAYIEQLGPGDPRRPSNNTAPRSATYSIGLSRARSCRITVTGLR